MKRRIVLEVDDAAFREQIINRGFAEISPVEYYLMPQAGLTPDEQEYASEVGEFGITVISDEEM